MKRNAIFVGIFVFFAWNPGLLCENATAGAAPFALTAVLCGPAAVLPGLVDPVPLAVNCEVACERNFDTCWSHCIPQDWPCLDRCLSLRHECRCACPNPDIVECSGLP